MTTPIGEGAQGGAEGTQSGAGGSIDPTGTTGTDTTSGAQSGAETPANSEADSLRAQLEQQRQRTLAADKRAGDVEQQLRQLRDKDLPEAEKLQRDFQESQQQVIALQATNSRLAAEVAFLKDNTYSWHNPETALRLVDMTQVTINPDGSASGMKEALKALATANPFLVKQEASQPEENKPPASTSPGNNGTGATGTNALTPQKMAARFPAMNTRARRS